MDSFQQIDSHDSRYGMKQRDIAATIARMGEQKQQAEAEWERKFDDTLVDVTMENVLRGGGDRSILHGSERYRSNYQKWLDSLEG
jgi:uncharacterized protein YukE